MEQEHNTQGQEIKCSWSNILAFASISRIELASTYRNDLGGGFVDIGLEKGIVRDEPELDKKGKDGF